MSSLTKYRKLSAITVFAVAFGYIESAVVVYLRELYYPNGFIVPFSIGFPFIRFGASPFLAAIPQKIMLIEVFREAATIILLGAAAFLAGKSFKERLGVFLWPFAVWDIFYYVFLRLTIGWPQSLNTPDVLFLIPVPWIAPVWMPLAGSAAMIAASATLLRK